MSTSDGPHARAIRKRRSMSRPSEMLITLSSTAATVRVVGSLARMRIGLALPQYDYSIAGERPLRFETIVDYARLAEQHGAEAVWLSDHIFLDLAKYGGPEQREACFDPIVTLAALARLVPRVRLGTLVLLEALRPAAVLAKALATLDCVSGGRLDVGLGAGWYEPEYDAINMPMPRPGARLDRLVDALEVVKGLLDG